MPFASTKQFQTPITLQMTTGASPVKSAGLLHSLNTSPSSTRRQAAEGLEFWLKKAAQCAGLAAHMVKANPQLYQL